MKIQHQSTHLTIFESALYRTTTTFFHNKDICLLVDPNWLPEEVAFIKNYVNEIRKEQILHLLFTHSDYDHIIGFRAFDNVKVIASAAFHQEVDKEKCLQAVRDFDDQHYIARDYPIEYPPVDFVVTEEGQQLHFGETTLSCYSAGGHTLDGLFTIIEPYGIWIAGDYICNVEFPFIYESSTAYLKTIERMEMIMNAYSINYLIAGHGDFTTSTDEIKQRIAIAKQYIHELRASIEKQQDFDLQKWLNKYPFQKFLEKAHHENVVLVSKELNKQPTT